VLHVEGYSVIIAKALVSTLSNSSMWNLDYASILAETITNGILYSRQSLENYKYSFVFHSLAEWLLFPGTSIVNAVGDATNTFIKLQVDFNEPIILKPEFEDRMCFTVQDDLSGLDVLKIMAGCKVQHV